MGDLNEFSLTVRAFLKVYPWRRIDPVPWTSLRKPLAESRVALISSAGLVLPDQRPFDKTVRGGDVTFRQIPTETDVKSLVETHRSESFDHRGLLEDPNLVFPLDRLREFAAGGRIGSLNRRHLSFMGSITAPGRLVRDTAPEAASWLVEDNADVALCIPV